MKLIMKTARSAAIDINDSGVYYTQEKYKVIINGKFYRETNKIITSVYGLKPDTDYVIGIEDLKGNTISEVKLKTDYEFVTLDVKDFGAKGDGENDDTSFIQAAILACPKDSRVYIPAGRYKVTSLFLKSDLNLEIAKDAELIADTDRTKYPIFPGLVESYDEEKEYNLGTWEGNPLKSFSSIITGINVENVVIYGEGCVNGNASFDNWWKDAKIMNIAFRPRLFFINKCDNIKVQGIKFMNSPSWTIHPYFSDNLTFCDLTVNNPHNSPNTDGLDPESCENVNIVGVHFSLGDDCIAVKSGKIYMGKKYKKSAKNTYVRQCFMENGHGAVTVGSEMAGGVRNLIVENCRFSNTDRGLRIKTRRGRGKDAVLDNISFSNIKMEHVMTPFVVNSFYFCDPDGKTNYVQSRDEFPVDDRTPEIKKLVFRNIKCTNCHVAAAHFDGLPEKKISEIVMENVDISFADKAKKDVPAMSCGVDACSKKGIYANNVENLILNNVKIQGFEGEEIELVNVDKNIVNDASYTESKVETTNKITENKVFAKKKTNKGKKITKKKANTSKKNNKK